MPRSWPVKPETDETTDETRRPVAAQPVRAKPSAPWWRILGGLAGAALVVFLWIRFDRQALVEWKAEAGPLPFFAALAVLPAIGVPTTPFYVLAGATFGVAGGLAGSAVSLAINLLLCYWIGHRSGLRAWLARRLQRWSRELPELEGGRALRFALVVKLAPGAPTFLKTYLLVIAGVPFRLYFGLSFVVTMAWAAGFIVLGESMQDRDFSQAAWAIAVLAALALAVGLGVRHWRKRGGSI